MKIYAILVLCLSVLFFSACVPGTSQSETEPLENFDQQIDAQQEELREEAGVDELVEVGEDVAEVATYINYSQTEMEEAAVRGTAVLFFHASWCPTCRALDTQLKNNLEDLPGDVTILKVDYDDASDLKEKYGVTYQHTLVQVDAEGNEITKWNGGGIEEIKQNIK